MTPSDTEIAKLRAEQIKAVMPLIGPLLDQWDGMSNDAKSTLRWDNPTLCEYLDKINAAMVSADPDPELASQGRGATAP